MMKNFFPVIVLLFVTSALSGQTLVSFGNHKISRNEFLTAYRKNNTNKKATEKSYRDYLDLYIRYRLKVQAAYDKKMDSLPGQLSELQNFRSQIADQYINDEGSLDRMTEEAFRRSQKDIRLSYIIVTLPKAATPADTLKAWKKIHEALADLKKNKSFEETALAYSDDPFVKTNQGDLGYITVFDLPYDIENVAYQTAPGKISPVFRTDGGYLIIKKTAERKALGRMQAAQILLIFPYQADDQAKADTRRRADSLYQAIRSGSDFGELARKFSGDNLSYQLGGVLSEFGIGKYEPEFEKQAYSLKKDGDISEPFASSFGYHILKRIARIPVSETKDKKTMDALKERVKTDRRIEVSRKEMLQSILKKTGFKQLVQPGDHLFAFADSLVQGKKEPAIAGLNTKTLLCRFPDKTYTVGDWVEYRKSLNRVPSLVSGKTDRDLFDQYRQTIAFDYYRTHLERYNKDFAYQVSEFRDGNLLFEIMQKQVWEKAGSDTVALKNYFEQHADQYRWVSSADAIIFNAGDSAAAGEVRRNMLIHPENWRRMVDSLGGRVQADSGRFEMKQLPGNGIADEQHFTSITSNPDKTVQLAYIVRKHADPSPRSFDDARGLVINDYQNELENKWIAELKKKYPVRVNEEVFRSLLK
jgi:peptidyl-prolyl cis-trans isomerase SurA